MVLAPALLKNGTSVLGRNQRTRSHILRIPPDEGLFLSPDAQELRGRCLVLNTGAPRPLSRVALSKERTPSARLDEHKLFPLHPIPFPPLLASVDGMQELGSLLCSVRCVPGRDSTSGYVGPTAPSKTETSCVSRSASCDGSRQLHIFSTRPPFQGEQAPCVLQAVGPFLLFPRSRKKKKC